MRGTKKKKHNSGLCDLISLVRVVALLSPLIAYLIIIICIFPAPNSGFIAIGVMGSLFIGLGLVNVVGLFDQMSLGHVVSAITLLLGALLLLVSSLVMYIPAIYSQLKEEYVTFYFIIWAILLISVIYYPFFRHAVTLYLKKHGVSKTEIKKELKGAGNYWFYRKLRQNIPNKWLYIVNDAFVCVFLCTISIQLLLGWWKCMYPIISFAVCFLLTLNLNMNWLIFTTWGDDWSDRNRLSILAMLGGYVFPIAACIGIVRYLHQVLLA